jgi:hypothetical protein
MRTTVKAQRIHKFIRVESADKLLVVFHNGVTEYTMTFDTLGFAIRNECVPFRVEAAKALKALAEDFINFHEEDLTDNANNLVYGGIKNVR